MTFKPSKEDQINIKNDWNQLLNEFYHPNPNISFKASELLILYWPDEFLGELMINLANKDVSIRRKSIKPIASYGEKSLKPILNLYILENDNAIRTSCLKVLIQMSNYIELAHFKDEIMPIVKLAIKDDSPEIILTVISLLKIKYNLFLPILFRLSEDKDILRAKASISVLIELEHPLVETHLKELMVKKDLDPLLKQSLNYF